MTTDLLAAPGERPGERPGVVAPMDPRLRARRLEVARSTGRRRRRRLLAAVVAVVVVGGGVALTRSPLLDVDQVVVRGAARTGRAEVQAASGLEPGRPLLWLDTGAAVDRLEDLPWVESAQVSWSWSGTVTVAVQERTPVAVVGTDRASLLVDASGRVLGPADEGVVLPAIAGPAPEAGERLSQARRAAVAVVADLPAALTTEVVEVSAGGRGITLELDDGIEVAWGDPGRTSAKAHDLQLVLAQAGRRTIDRIDVSVPGAPALTRRAGGGE